MLKRFQRLCKSFTHKNDNELPGIIFAAERIIDGLTSTRLSATETRLHWRCSLIFQKMSVTDDANMGPDLLNQLQNTQFQESLIKINNNIFDRGYRVTVCRTAYTY